MQITLIRHATLLVDWGDVSLLVDPMLSPAGAMDPVGNSALQERIPMVELPIDDEGLRGMLARVTGVLVTHTHRDHWDARAAELVPQDKPLLCQPPDAEKLRGEGFTTVTPIERELHWSGLQLTRYGGKHGTGELGERMGPVSGFVIHRDGHPTLYIAGDTVWHPEVERALAECQPDVTVLNAGAAQFLTGDPITMSDADIALVCSARPRSAVVAVHLDTINHCLQTRAKLVAALRQRGLGERVIVPADGDVLPF
jgi:L-ascorbate metabolism protein UlaG (beta-lactamase superfamily)